jgi:hypothetical protein
MGNGTSSEERDKQKEQVRIDTLLKMKEDILAGRLVMNGDKTFCSVQGCVDQISVGSYCSNHCELLKQDIAKGLFKLPEGKTLCQARGCGELIERRPFCCEHACDYFFVENEKKHYCLLRNGHNGYHSRVGEEDKDKPTKDVICFTKHRCYTDHPAHWIRKA